MITVVFFLQDGIELETVKSYICAKPFSCREILNIAILDKNESKALENAINVGYLPVSAGRGIHPLPLNSIVYIEKDQRYVFVHMEDGAVHTFYGKLKDIDPFLSRAFCRCHNSYVVNMKKVEAIERYRFCLKNGGSIPISQKRYQSSKSEFEEYLKWAAN